MIQQIKEQFPIWCEDSNTNYSLLLSDDIDSFMCYILQKQLFGREINHFLDVNFEKASRNNYGKQMLYGTRDIDWENIIGLDIALENNIKVFDNHVVKVSREDKVNPNSANLNSIMNICATNYKDKFVVSSFITMLSYYDYDLSSWNKEQLAVLSAIDGVYQPFVNPRFKEKGRKNLAILGYEFLADFIEENLDYIVGIENKLNLKYGKIWIDEGYLETNIDLLGLELIFMDVFKSSFSLPEFQFKELKTYMSKYISFDGKNNRYDKNILNVNDRLINFALTYKKLGVVGYNLD